MSTRKKPTKAQLEHQVAAFNRQIAVGDEVDYFAVIEDGVSQRYKTRSPAEVLSGHTAVVWLEGKSGCVACSHCFMPPGVAA